MLKEQFVKKQKNKYSKITLIGLEALKEAGRKLIEERKRTGDPLVVWKDGKVAYLYYNETGMVREEPAKYEAIKKGV
jgi:hypothetical protein